MILAATVGSMVATKVLMAKAETPTILSQRLRMAREQAGLSQPELAERVGMSQQGINAIENSESQRPRKLKEIARAVGRSQEWLLGEAEVSKADSTSASLANAEVQPNASFPPSFRPFSGRFVPLLGQSSAGENGRFYLNGQELGSVFCPPILDGVDGAYAVLVYGDSMEPKFEAGETVWLHPYLPVRKGDYVVAQITTDGDDAAPGSYIKQFVSRSATKLILRQFNPGEGESELLEFPAPTVFSVHKVVFHQLV